MKRKHRGNKVRISFCLIDHAYHSAAAINGEEDFMPQLTRRGLVGYEIEGLDLEKEPETMYLGNKF
jgi:hypothetical protein